MSDKLMNIRQLPTSLLKQLDKLIVNRCGNRPDAYMITKDILGFIVPELTYKLAWQKNELMLQVSSDVFTPPEVKPSKPPYACFSGDWIHQENLHTKDANILGGLGTFQVDSQEEIPVIDATAETLAFYHADFLSVGSLIKFETEMTLPLTDVAIGKDYVKHYLTQADHGGGEYIEYHDQPHLWMPNTPHCSGHILLGKKINDLYYFTGFRIPYGHAVYMAPHTLHSDAYLVGNYKVVYSVTENYSTVRFNHEQPRLRFIQ